MSKAISVSPPDQSRIQSRVDGAYFYDAWQVAAAHPELTPLEQLLRLMHTTPGWVDALMRARNRVVKAFGLKDLGDLSGVNSKPASEYQPGDRVGIFTLIESQDDEVLVGDDDSHLNVVLSLHQQLDQKTGKTLVTVTTVVHIKNWVGRLYMLPVAPAHKIIASAMTRAIGRV